MDDEETEIYGGGFGVDEARELTYTTKLTLKTKVNTSKYEVKQRASLSREKE